MPRLEDLEKLLERGTPGYTVEIHQARDFHTDKPGEYARISWRGANGRERVVLAVRPIGGEWRPTWFGENPGDAVPIEPGELELGERLRAALNALEEEK